METPANNVSEFQEVGNTSGNVSGSPGAISSGNRSPVQGRDNGSPTSESSKRKNFTQTREEQVQEIRGMFAPASPYCSSGSEDEKNPD